MITYRARDFSHLIGMKGFSQRMLENHFQLYEGYVTNANKMIEKFSSMPKDAKSPEFAEMRRRFGWEWNGIRLHEYYFDNLGGKAQLKDSDFKKALEKEFGGMQQWEEDFKATGGMRGIGWSVLYRDNFTGALFNCWINEHDTGHLSGCSPILILDVFEHAFMIDYGIKKDEYIAAFMSNINWDIAIDRYKNAISFEPVDAAFQPVS